MSKSLAIVVVAAAITASACGATSRTTTIQTPPSPTLTSAAVTFISRDHGKDKDSALTVQLLRGNAELAADVRANGFKFDDNSSSGPFAFAVTGPFRLSDIDDSQIRVRLTPDGRDDWTFDMNLVMRFSDGSTRTFFWRGIRLDNTEPERTFTLAAARLS
jgi:hypothetical protein